MRRDLLGEAFFRVEPGAHGGTALRQRVDVVERLGHAPDALLDLEGVAAEFLAQRHRGGVLGVGAADLDDVLESLGLVGERAVQLLQARQRHVARHHRDRHVHRRGESVVRGLAHVDVVVGVDRFFRSDLAAQHLDGAVRDHLVGVHVRLGARSGLPDDEREMVVPFALDHFGRRLDDGPAEFRIEQPELHVGFCGGLFDRAERADDGDGLLFPADGEVQDRALGLRAPVAVGGDLERSEAVGLSACRGHGHLPVPAFDGGSYSRPAGPRQPQSGRGSGRS